MIETIKNPSDKLFYDLVEESEKSIDLCSPFTHENIINNILEKKKETSYLRLITSANLADFYAGYSHIQAIKRVVSRGFKSFNYQNLHANIYLFDKVKALVTSSNLTNDGFSRNYEYGIMIIDEIDITRKIAADFDEMTKNYRCGSFNKTVIDSIEKLITGFDNRTNVRFDASGDNHIHLTDKGALLHWLTPWQRDIFTIIDRLNTDIFNLETMYSHESVLQNIHPNNHHIDAKIRQILQQLRDIGLVRFLDRGVYKRLWR
jgi:phosphatidylserine/phosphatidylglycerophosphate/cardiolipin synthase-like enzyme